LPNYISITTKFVTSSIANAIRPPTTRVPNYLSVYDSTSDQGALNSCASRNEE